MDNKQNVRTGVRRLSQNKGQEVFKISDGLINEDYSNKQLPQQGKDFNLLSVYYNKKSGNGNFMEKIGRLNKKFYNCSDKYVKSKKLVEKLSDDLYLNLFHQINCYVEEIERLNQKLSLNNNQELRKTIEQLNKEISDKKEKIRNYENKIKEKINNEEKLKKEIESYKRSLIFYKDKIKIGILSRNRNPINTLGRKTNSFYYRKKSNKNPQNNYLSPSPSKKKKLLKNKTSRDLNLKLDSEINNKENNLEKEEKEKTINILNSEEKIEKVNKIFKIKESFYKIDRENNFLENRDYDIYGKDIEEKEDEENNSFELVRPIEKSKSIKIKNKDKNSQETSPNYSSGLLNALTQELYGSSENTAKNTIENDSNKDLFSINKNINSESTSEKRESILIDAEEKSKTLNLDKKGNNTTKNIKKINKFSNNVNKSGNLKQKNNNQNNNYRSNKSNNKMILKTENDSNTNKTKQAKTSTKSKPKNYNKSTDKVSSFSEVHTPYVKKKFKKQIDKDKEKNIPISNKTPLSTESTPSFKYNSNTLSSNQGRANKNIEIGRRTENNAIEENKYMKMKRKKTDLNTGYNSMSNLNVLGKYNPSSKVSRYKKNEIENNKELTSVFKDVNDDYIKSIEMLRKQEEQIKYMLRFIDLDDEN